MRKRTIALFAVLAVAVGVFVPNPPIAAIAADASQFDPGYLIADQYFYDESAMTQAEIQQFLEQKAGTCRNSNCLAVHRVDTFDRAAVDNCRAYPGASQELASAVLFKVQQACGISAKVLLVTLQKEQGLITNSAPSDLVMRKAMGYGCPDTADCDARYYGVYNQLYGAAKQLAWYRTGYSTPGSSFYKRLPPGQYSNILFHPDAARCGSAPVLIQNFATAALYFYTPYQPNSSALGNLYGPGDTCGSYGNRNFWRMYTDWFGSPTLPPGSPVSELETVDVGFDRISLSGWAVDPSAPPEPIMVSAELDGHWYVTTADRPNGVAGDRVSGAGTNHGFAIEIPVSKPGGHRLCVYAINVGAGANATTSCRTVNVPDASPVGEVKAIWSTIGAVQLWGWAADPDAPGVDIDVSISVNQDWHVTNAGAAYPAPVHVIPNADGTTGFGATIPAVPGAKDVCVYALNVGLGAHTQLGCWPIIVYDGSPIGSWDGVHGLEQGISVWGWAADVDAVDPTVDIALRIDTEWALIRANAPYSTPQLGGVAHHGWGAILPASAGAHQVCAWALNVDLGSDLGLGCRSVTVPVPATRSGAVSVRDTGGVLVSGVGVEIRRDSCEGPAVWRGITALSGASQGAMSFGLRAGRYCALTTSSPNGFGLAAPTEFAVSSMTGNWATLWVPNTVDGALAVKDARGIGINGATALIRQGTCVEPGAPVWEATTLTNPWADGGFGITLQVGTYCSVVTAVPAGFKQPEPVQTTVSTPGPVWITHWAPSA